MSSESILVAVDGPIATVTFNRPQQRNALDYAAWQRLAQVMGELSADDALRCVVLRGAGGQAFSAGADISEFPTRRLNAQQAAQYGAVTHRAMQAIAECRHPTLALIEGSCVGGGLEMASMCDMRICGASSRFGVPVNKLGLVMSYGELRGLIALTGSAIAMEIVLEGRVFDAREALDKRLVNRVVADAQVAEESYAAARRICQGAPLVARWHKRFAQRLARPEPLTAEEWSESYACFDTEDFRIGYRAFLDKTRPEFVGR
ncbi:enoyl-CoA hydratase/isomerase family protein [Bordetella genomosp. 13]|uniref:Enoyl-CoA hydratase n=1 Tax=Bordetella genomosp. 13 TaxID=463040 RepID=A0A1W6ZI86_9BORD|nr:enoyl-CoA hydratase-related protein [Bordetella genomosp. 13]ARP97022.1 enoyl-CoA hydratase [Bordetella genomosp. 13]